MKKIDNSECLKEFGQFIKKQREHRQILQSEIAQELGIGQSYYSLIEHGKREVDLMTAIQICSILKLDMSEFVNKYM